MKLSKLDETTADYTRNGLTPRYSDLDVNKVKYTGWILEFREEEYAANARLFVMQTKQLNCLPQYYRLICAKAKKNRQRAWMPSAKTVSTYGFMYVRKPRSFFFQN
uniref:Palmitoyl-acyl carrier protein thioesterase, chloroplastic n=1 Tax=Tanacetum cinerariifolium TaxID=118510 RepID=A0A699GIF9_TANCI|nr:palmitoyl-acyl carrier protein thioesterase, chloroplastic [Tanacetum cinerariifolium]